MESEIKYGRLIELLKKKKDTLENIKKLTTEMIRVLENKNHEELTGLLSLRREAMNESGKIDDEILRETRGRENFALILKESEAVFHVNEIRRNLNELKALDDELNEKARNIFDELEQKIDEYYRAKEAYIKYRNLFEGSSPQYGFFIDQKK
ncbi:hypothetical protein [Thermosediminibacter litoriperuensis]|uniref:FlgN protein n=1 Tax=Thermosediminibacter litoriperuensis TaxID=291989 RepID=A0A5S5AXJ5_9FIRM|nr:hypothetical protein [Thermosediminibacter litoriperuensis]TYP58580.1 hypothetical protein LZ11_00426 [Thermosediminibacter litoriperuensis]